MASSSFLADYYRLTGNRRLFPRFIIDYLFRHNVRFLYWLRRRSEKGGVISKYKLYRLSRKFGLEFSPAAVIGKGLYLGHPYNITVGNGVVLGQNVNIHKGATLGVENRGKRIGAPTIGNCVYIGINATVVGKITVGDDVLIAPGAYVNFDVPSHSIVLGNPGQIHSCENATEGYIRNRVS